MRTTFFTLFRWLGLGLVAMMLCACPSKDPTPTDPSNPTDPTNPTPGPGGKEDEPYFNIQLINTDTGAAMNPIPAEIVFPNNSRGNKERGGIPVIIDTNLKDEEWSITTSNYEICSISWGDYNGKTERYIDCLQYVYEYSPEKNPAPRECDITISAGSLFNKTIHIVQQGIVSFIIPDKKEGEAEVVSPSGETLEHFVFSTAYKWSAESDADWLKISTPDANTLRITASPRSDSDANKRTAVVTLHDLCTLSSWQTAYTITITDADAALGGDDYNYGDHIDWN